MRMSLFCLLFIMDQAQEVMEETTEIVNPMDLDPSVSNTFDFVRSEHASTEALLVRVLD